MISNKKITITDCFLLQSAAIWPGLACADYGQCVDFAECALTTTGLCECYEEYFSNVTECLPGEQQNSLDFLGVVAEFLF